MLITSRFCRCAVFFSYLTDLEVSCMLYATVCAAITSFYLPVARWTPMDCKFHIIIILYTCVVLFLSSCPVCDCNNWCLSQIWGNGRTHHFDCTINFLHGRLLDLITHISSLYSTALAYRNWVWYIYVCILCNFTPDTIFHCMGGLGLKEGYVTLLNHLYLYIFPSDSI